MTDPRYLEPLCFPAEALLGLAFAARRLEAKPASAEDTFRVASVTSRVFTIQEIAAFAAECGLAASIATPDEALAGDEVVVSVIGASDRAYLTFRDERGVARTHLLTVDGSQIRATPTETPRWSPEACALKLQREPGPARDDAAARPKFHLGWFWERIKRHGAEVRMVLLAAALVHVIGLVSPLIFAALVDRVLPNQEQATLLALVLIATLAIGMDYVLRVQRDRKIAWVAARVDSRTSEETFRHLLSLPLRYFNGAKAGVVARNLRLTEDVREFITGPATEAAIKLMALPFALVVLCFLSVWLTLVVLAAGLLLALVLSMAWGPYRLALQRLTELEGCRQALAVETIHGASTVKALAIEDALLARWKPLTAEIAATNERMANLGARVGARMDAIERVADLAIIAIGILLVMQGQLSVGALIAFKLIAAQVIEPMVHAASLAQQWQTNKRQVELLGDIMDAEPEVGAHREAPLEAPRLTGGFEFKNVSFSYRGASRPAVEAFDLYVPTPGEEGCVIAIVGESGSGKSTVTKMLLGLHPPDAGQLEFIVANDEDPEAAERRIDARDLHPGTLRRTLAIVAQDNQFFAGTIRENLEMALQGRPHRESDLLRALHLACATGFVAALPEGLNTRLEENAANLSGGQRQRLSIARALLRDPPILVLDEATSALDVETELAFRDNMRAFAEGRTLVMVAHRLNTVRDANVILVMKDGRVVEAGDHDALLAEGGLYRRMWDAQTGETRGHDFAEDAEADFASEDLEDADQETTP